MKKTVNKISKTGFTGTGMLYTKRINGSNNKKREEMRGCAFTVTEGLKG